MRRLLLLLVVVLVIMIGVAGVVAGEADDSPGLQFIGFVLVAGAAVSSARMVRHRRPGP